MICPACQCQREQKDFIRAQVKCYRCSYQEKLQLLREHKAEKKKNFCAVCQKEIKTDDKLKKRQRNVYCSLGCAEKAHKQHVNNHWTKRFRKEFKMKFQGKIWN